MAHSDSEDEVEAIDDLDFDVSEPDDANEEYIMNAEAEVEDGTSGAEEVCAVHYPTNCTQGQDIGAGIGLWGF